MVKDITTTGQQIDLRLQQACFWPWQYFMARRRAWTNTSITRAQYISMWLVANDVIIGIAFGSFLISNNAYMTDVLQRYDYTIDTISAVLEWLTSKNEYPAGLKLNPELNPFLGQLFKWLIDIWADFIISLQPFVPIIINMIGLSGAFGATMSLSLISDLLAFTSLHIYWFYLVAARIFHWQLMILYSLFNLFRVKDPDRLPGGLRLEVCPERFFFDRATPLRWVVSSFRSASADYPAHYDVASSNYKYPRATGAKIGSSALSGTLPLDNPAQHAQGGFSTGLSCELNSRGHQHVYGVQEQCLKDENRSRASDVLYRDPVSFNSLYLDYDTMPRSVSYLMLSSKDQQTHQLVLLLPRSRFTIQSIKPTLSDFWVFCEDILLNNNEKP
ncbi:phosphatidylinositol N-acetylglucosaminyltransferase subunit gpi1 [Lunasporangiospora selenospora]|uniref:Phosphatidylinositol N-acetylglucosaminyltransferase subunit gpi1 n=1 Tax=Lunasporangiospora selenospora TaxID=979761 RepID=A0A9P6G2H9_9FUNG|nr:phosphatidylinositol N-acetylglucosaminyltransferase subunit gpi1 [Lunasporangiospora selenospora]